MSLFTPAADVVGAVSASCFSSVSGPSAVHWSGSVSGGAGLTESLFPFALKDEFCYEKELCYRHVSGRSLNFMTVTRLDISSSQVRSEAAAGRSLRYLVPDQVVNYILDCGLYN